MGNNTHVAKGRHVALKKPAKDKGRAVLAADTTRDIATQGSLRVR
jgi:hypothetical protein